MNALLAIQLLTQILTQAQGLSAVLQKAHAEGRDITDAELDSLASADNASKERLQTLIDAKGNTR